MRLGIWLDICSLELVTFSSTWMWRCEISAVLAGWMEAWLAVCGRAEEGGEAANAADKGEREESKFRARRRRCYVTLEDERHLRFLIWIVVSILLWLVVMLLFVVSTLWVVHLRIWSAVHLDCLSWMCLSLRLVRRVELCPLCKQLLKVVELSFEDLVLCSQCRIVELQLVVLLDYLFVLVLKDVLFRLFLLTWPDCSLSVLVFLHSCDWI